MNSIELAKKAAHAVPKGYNFDEFSNSLYRRYMTYACDYDNQEQLENEFDSVNLQELFTCYT